MRRLVCGTLAAVFSAGTALSAGEKLFENGKSDFRIVIPAQPHDSELKAAADFQDAVRKMSGVTLPVEKTDAVPEKNAVVIGSLKTCEAVRKLKNELKLDTKKLEKLAVYTRGGNLYLAGNIPRAALYATYSFLRDSLGCRWFWYGDDGEFIPERASYELPELSWNYEPKIPVRALDSVGSHTYPPVHEWLPKVFISSFIGGGLVRASGHGMRLSPDMYEKYPNAFAMLGGKRGPEGTVGCWTSPDFLKAMIEKHRDRIAASDMVGIAAADVTTRCECETCSKMDKSELWFSMYKKFIEEARKINPDAICMSIAYQSYRYVPRNMKDFSWLDFIEYTAYNQCHIHAVDDPSCGINRMMLEELKKWEDVHVPVGIYGYVFDRFDGHAESPFFIPNWNTMARNVKFFASKNAFRMKEEMPVRANTLYPTREPGHVHRLAYYLYAMMLWDPDQDVDALLKDFCQHVYGPGADDMHEYFRQIAAAWDRIPGHLTYFKSRAEGTVQHLFSVTRERAWHKLLADAADKIRTGVRSGDLRTRYLRNIEIDLSNLDAWNQLWRKGKRGVPKAEIPLLEGDDAFDRAAVLPVNTDVPWVNRKTGKPLPRAVPAEIRAYYTKDALHMRFICRDPEIAKRCGTESTVNGGPNQVELFLDPRGDNPYYQFMVTNTAGAMYKAKAFTLIPDFPSRTETKVTDEYWQVDMVFPFAGFGLSTPKKGSSWLIVAMIHDRVWQSASFPVTAYHDMPSGAELVFE